jgi:hypothetical protein
MSAAEYGRAVKITVRVANDLPTRAHSVVAAAESVKRRLVPHAAGLAQLESRAAAAGTSGLGRSNERAVIELIRRTRTISLKLDCD